MKHLMIIPVLLMAFAAQAEDHIGTAETKGLIAKDKIKITAFDDPDIKGVTCYTTYYDKALSWSDSTSTSIACRQTGPISGKLGPRKNVFSKSKNLFFKTTVVQRFYDAKRKVLVYLTYTTATSGNNADHSISVVVVK